MKNNCLPSLFLCAFLTVTCYAQPRQNAPCESFSWKSGVAANIVGWHFDFDYDFSGGTWRSQKNDLHGTSLTGINVKTIICNGKEYYLLCLGYIGKEDGTSFSGETAYVISEDSYLALLDPPVGIELTFTSSIWQDDHYIGPEARYVEGGLSEYGYISEIKGLINGQSGRVPSNYRLFLVRREDINTFRFNWVNSSGPTGSVGRFLSELVKTEYFEIPYNEWMKLWGSEQMDSENDYDDAGFSRWLDEVREVYDLIEAGALSPEEIARRQMKLYEEYNNKIDEWGDDNSNIVIAAAPDGYVNIRTGPSVNCPIIGKLKNGIFDRYGPGSKNVAGYIFDAGKWILVEYNGIVGYVNKKQTKVFYEVR